MLPEELSSLIEAMLPLLARCHAQGDLAPHAAVRTRTGEAIGNALVSDNEMDLTADQAIDELEFRQTERALAGEITAAAVFYHASAFAGEYRPARTTGEANAIVAHVENERGASFAVVIPYERAQPSGWTYCPARVYSKERRVFVV